MASKMILLTLLVTVIATTVAKPTAELMHREGELNGQINLDGNIHKEHETQAGYQVQTYNNTKSKSTSSFEGQAGISGQGSFDAEFGLHSGGQIKGGSNHDRYHHNTDTTSGHINSGSASGPDSGSTGGAQWKYEGGAAGNHQGSVTIKGQHNGQGGFEGHIGNANHASGSGGAQWQKEGSTTGKHQGSVNIKGQHSEQGGCQLGNADHSSGSGGAQWQKEGSAAGNHQDSVSIKGQHSAQGGFEGQIGNGEHASGSGVAQWQKEGSASGNHHEGSLAIEGQHSAHGGIGGGLEVGVGGQGGFGIGFGSLGKFGLNWGGQGGFGINAGGQGGSQGSFYLGGRKGRVGSDDEVSENIISEDKGDVVMPETEGDGATSEKDDTASTLPAPTSLD